MRETPFMLIYGLEIMHLVEVAIHAHRVASFQETLNTQSLQRALDLLPMVRGDTYLRKHIAKA